MFNGTGQTKRLGRKAQSGDLVEGRGGGQCGLHRSKTRIVFKFLKVTAKPKVLEN